MAWIVKKEITFIGMFVLSLIGISTYFKMTDIHAENHKVGESEGNNVSGNIPVSIKEAPNMLDGCYHVYIDVGTNVGIQIRKLFEPEKYPKAKVHSIFNSIFGNITERLKKTPDGGSMICAIGFEPNPGHTKQLKKIESIYMECGWKVKMMTTTAVSNKAGTTRFFSDGTYKYKELGGGILPPNINKLAKSISSRNENHHDVTLIRLSDFLKNIVATRKLPTPPNTKPPKVLVKMDIEGSEVDVIPDLVFAGGLQYITTIMVEWHERLEKLQSRIQAQRQLQLAIKALSSYSKAMKGRGNEFDFTSVDLDDETYFMSEFEFPEC